MNESVRHQLGVVKGVLATLMACAPDSFPTRDYLPADKQPNLDREFDRLRNEYRAFVDAYGQTSDTERWHLAIEQSYDLYKRGDKPGGGKILNDFYNEIWSTKELAKKRPRKSG